MLIVTFWFQAKAKFLHSLSWRQSSDPSLEDSWLWRSGPVVKEDRYSRNFVLKTCSLPETILLYKLCYHYFGQRRLEIAPNKQTFFCKSFYKEKKPRTRQESKQLPYTQTAPRLPIMILPLKNSKFHQCPDYCWSVPYLVRVHSLQC